MASSPDDRKEPAEDALDEHLREALSDRLGAAPLERMKARLRDAKGHAQRAKKIPNDTKDPD